MRSTLETKISEAKSLLDVLLILKDKTMLDTHVATLAYLRNNITKFNGKYGVWECSPLPLDGDQAEYLTQAYYFTSDGDNFKADSLVLVVFTDMNFINNLQSTTAVPKRTDDVILHSVKYGIIVYLPALGLSDAEKAQILNI